MRISTVLLLALVIAVPGCAGVGTESLPGRPAHHVAGGYKNLDPSYRRPGAWTRIRFFARRGWSSLARTPAFTPPQESADGLGAGRALRQENPEPSVTWIGHATLLIQLGGVNLLTDPHWGERASPLRWAGPKRLAPPGLPFEELPRIDAVVISHDHYDHLDVGTVVRLAKVHDPLFLVPLGYTAWFAGAGITRVEELDWWQSRRVGAVEVVCAPAQHWTQRSPFDTNRRLWASWIVLGAARRFYFSGDSGYHDGFREIGTRFGPFDLAALAIGAYLPPELMQRNHVTPEEAVQAFVDVRGQRLLGIHWGTFDLAEEPLGEPPGRMVREAGRRGIAPDRTWLMKVGETRRW
ncbi:MAG: MBL fold metallo-hydrolase [Candidatus Rokubacteria bacterium]|nr:MBL fold metallo-hydrolase [Candidatus Rokubacteria bacterium]